MSAVSQVGWLSSTVRNMETNRNVHLLFVWWFVCACQRIGTKCFLNLAHLSRTIPSSPFAVGTKPKMCKFPTFYPAELCVTSFPAIPICLCCQTYLSSYTELEI